MRDTMTISISGRWWSFPGAQIDGDSWEGEWCGDGEVYLHDAAGNVVKGRELSEAEIEQFSAKRCQVTCWSLLLPSCAPAKVGTKVQPEMSSMRSST
jgi:hypothetical protein